MKGWDTGTGRIRAAPSRNHAAASSARAYGYGADPRMASRCYKTHEMSFIILELKTSSNHFITPDIS